MKTKRLSDVLERVEMWPPHVQDELAEIAHDIDEGIKSGDYEPNAAERAGIERGLRAADEGRFATDEQVNAAFAKLRKA
jgi:predicted transcriptional regulator